MFTTMYLGTFNKLGGTNVLMKEGNNLNKKDFFIGVLLIFIKPHNLVQQKKPVNTDFLKH